MTLPIKHRSRNSLCDIHIYICVCVWGGGGGGNTHKVNPLMYTDDLINISEIKDGPQNQIVKKGDGVQSRKQTN